MNALTLQLAAAEILQDLLPVRRIIIPSQIGLQLARQDLQCSALSNTVRSHQAKHLTRSGHGQTVQLERVGRVAVGHLRFEVGGQVDDVDCVERAFLRTDAAADAETLTDEGDLARWVDLDAELARSYLASISK